MMNEPTHLEWSLPPKPSDTTVDASITEEVQPEQDKEDVLRAMLYVAEDEIRAKEVQVELMQQMLVTTESVPDDPSISRSSPIDAAPHPGTRHLSPNPNPNLRPHPGINAVPMQYQCDPG